MDRLCSHLGYEEFQSHSQVEDEGIAAVVKAIGVSKQSFESRTVVLYLELLPDANSYFQGELVLPSDKMDLLLVL